MHVERACRERLEHYASLAVCVGLFVLPVLTINGRLLTFAASDIALPIVFGAALLARWPLSRPDAAIPWALLLPFFIWLGWSAASAFCGVGIRINELDPYVLKKLIGFLVLAAYVVAGLLVGSRLGYDGAVLVLTTAAAIGSVIGVVRLFLLPIGADYASLPYGYRLIGMTHTPNLFGLHQASVIVLAMDWFRHNNLSPNWTTLPSWREWLLATVLAGLLLSGSRTALFALAAVLLCGLALSQISLISVVRHIALSILIAAAAFGLFSTYQVIAESLSRSDGPESFILSFLRTASNVGLATTENQGSDHRSYIHHRAVELFLQHPWFGIGLGQFYLGFQASGDPRAAEIHNSYLWILTELGVVGLVIAFWGIARVAKRAFRLSMDRWRVAPIALLVFYAIAAIGTDVIFQRPIYFFAGILASIAYAPNRSHAQRNT